MAADSWSFDCPPDVCYLRVFHSASANHACFRLESPVASGVGAWPVDSGAEAHQASAVAEYIPEAAKIQSTLSRLRSERNLALNLPESYSLDRTGAFPAVVDSVARPETGDSAADQEPPERHRARLVESVATYSGAAGGGSTFDPVNTGCCKLEIFRRKRHFFRWEVGEISRNLPRKPSRDVNFFSVPDAFATNFDSSRHFVFDHTHTNK